MADSLHAKTLEILDRYHLRARKTLSQNFLVNETILEKIIRAVSIQKGETVLEVGGGLGVVTEALAGLGGQIITLEVDRQLCAVLEDRLRMAPQVKILHKSILEFEPEKYFQFAKAVGNLPYHLSGLIVRWFLDRRASFSELYFMLQKEVAERIVSEPGPKTYGILSVLCQHFATPSILFDVPKGAFFPVPKVTSSFVKLIPKFDPSLDDDVFALLVKQAFRQRRKTLYNNLKSLEIFDQSGWKNFLVKFNIGEKTRGEAIPVQTYAAMASSIATQLRMQRT